jgi:DNA primase
MTDAAGNVVGIRLRRLDGSKFAVRGGNEGLFLPAIDPTDSRLLVCEGPTDAAALLDLGYRHVAGRPSCSGGVKLLVELVQRRRPADVVIVADGDEPGRRGADNLASILLVYIPIVRVVLPKRYKDVREFVQAGGTRPQLEQAIAAAPSRGLTVRAVAVERRTR